MTRYLVQTGYAKKLWIKRNGWPSINEPKRLLTLLFCKIIGHNYRPWMIDDMDGPGEEMEEGSFMPYCSRQSEPGEWGMRGCFRGCGISQVRIPNRFDLSKKAVSQGKWVDM